LATVLLTGAIRPAAVPLVLTDPQDRLLDTLCAITSWLREPAVERLVYFDGSGFLMPAVFDAPHFTALAADFGAAASAHGKGRADALIIGAAASSGILGDAFYKVTGRLYVENFAAVDIGLDRSRDFCAVPGAIRVPTRIPGVRRSLRAVETTFFWVRTSFFLERLASLADRIDDGSEATFIETVYASAVGRERVGQLAPKPTLVGRSASRGRPYVRDFDESVKETCRSLAQRIRID
jgi:hypothetical protein